MTPDPDTMIERHHRMMRPPWFTMGKLMIGFGLALTVLAFFFALSGCPERKAHGAELAESYSFNPSDNADMDGFLHWIGMQRLTPGETIAQLVGLGMLPQLAYHFVGGASMHCATPTGFLGFYLEPDNPAPRALCNTPGRVFTPEEVQHMCRVWGTDFGNWFPGDGERPPEATCVRKVNVQPGATCVRKVNVQPGDAK